MEPDYSAVLADISVRLANIEGLQTDFYHFVADVSILAIGITIGLVGFHLLFREGMKW